MSGSPELFEIAHSVALRFLDRDLNPLSGFIDRCIGRTGAGCGFTPGEMEFFIGDFFETDEIVEDAFYVQFIIDDFGVAEAPPDEAVSLRVVQAFDNAFVGVTFAPEPTHGAWVAVAGLALMAAGRSSNA